MLRILLALVTSCAAALAATDAIAAAPSSGCGARPERPPETFHVGGRERHAIVVLPQEYRADRAHVLLFAFHGRTNPNAQARRYFGLEAAARGSIYVYPAALSDRTGRFTWADPGDPPDALRDFALFDVLLDRITSAYCVDRRHGARPILPAPVAGRRDAGNRRVHRHAGWLVQRRIRLIPLSLPGLTRQSTLEPAPASRVDARIKSRHYKQGCVPFASLH